VLPPSSGYKSHAWKKILTLMGGERVWSEVKLKSGMNRDSFTFCSLQFRLLFCMGVKLGLS
jgi:hypothetical protein